MNTTVIDHAESTRDFRRIHVRTAPRRVSSLRRLRNLVELSDWDEAILRHGREIDAFCWMLAIGTAALMIPVSFLVMKS
ncbi:MAG: hypothetical protein MUE57_10720 [Syntrophales bacterium]|jgi:hypothetical protein|nr:hypothetical protein [Syntrophales bacterium]MCU0584294.1 hypothetical protein [Syntrophales bacterium]